MDRYCEAARQVISRCRALSSYTEEPGSITRTFLSEPMHSVHADVRRWMEDAGMRVRVDPAGDIRGLHGGSGDDQGRLIIGSHLDTVPNAGAFDGILGVMLGIAVVELAGARKLNFSIEVIGFSEEEGVRFGVPFIGSRAVIGDIDNDLLAKCDAQGVSVADTIRNFGLDPSKIIDARISGSPIGYLEFHIEQGPVLENLGLPLGIVQSIVGQSRLEIGFEGSANHAGTTPMHLRRDALTGAAEWIGAVEREAAKTPDLVATVGRVEVKPGAANVIPGEVTLSLDVRHPEDRTRIDAAAALLRCAEQIAARRSLTASSKTLLDQPSVAMDARLTDALSTAVRCCGYPIHRMHSGAGHDAMIMARRIPAAMLFVRSPGGISHHPAESVLADDVAAALKTGVAFLEELESARA